MKFFQFNIYLMIVCAAMSCSRIIATDDSPVSEDDLTLTGMDGLIVPDDFDYATTINTELSVVALDNQDNGLSGIRIDLLQPKGAEWELVASAITDANGSLTFNVPIATATEQLVLQTSYLGLPHSTIIWTDQLHEVQVLGGARNTSPSPSSRITNGRTMSGLIPVGDYYLLDEHDEQGVPYNLMEVSDHVSQDLLDLINSSLPESRPVPQYNAQYLADEIETNTLLGDSAEVWVTFVHEGAGWTNTLGYYTYSLDSPPTSVDDIDEMYVIFPNVSFKYGGGNLTSGDKVYLGSFSKDTGIGWFLIPRGWNGSGVVNRSQVKYSDKTFNTFTSDEYRQHTVLLKDDNRELLLLGMEDTSRPGGDNDFNDAVFYVTASPYSAIITDGLESTKTDGNPDSDGDGVSDQNDEYPNDPDKAFNIYTPSENTFGSLAFEDQWPSKGDYDMNDLVIDYNFKFVTNTANRAVQIDARLLLRAVGAQFHNGFGIELPIAPSLVSQITSDDPAMSLSLENGPANATIMIFEDAHNMIGSSGLINTVNGRSKVEVKEINFSIILTEPIAMSALGYAPFNPFITSNGDRTVEVHLPDKVPTSLADMSLLGDIHDKSNSANQTYYRSYNNLPWAINLPESFEYPEEYAPINEAHKQFKAWAESGGTQYKDWYKPLNGYRSSQKIYQ